MDIPTTVTITVEVTLAKAAEIIDVIRGGAAPSNVVEMGVAVQADKAKNEERLYGAPGEDRKRRTKEEMKTDEDIAARWEALWPSKEVPSKPVSELLAHLEKVEAENAGDGQEEDGFSTEEEEDGFSAEEEEAAEIMDLDEFRAILVKHSKTLGNKKLGELMAPHKNPGAVPEAERRDYADKVISAAAEA
jgi:hypothetical protein